MNGCKQIFSLRTCQKHTAAKHMSRKIPSKLLFGRHVYIWQFFVLHIGIRT